MNKLRGKLLAVFIIVDFVLAAITFFPGINVTGQATRTIRIVDPQTGSATVSLGSETEPLPPGGYPFTVNVILDGLTENLFDYQIAVSFNTTKVRCTSASIPKNDPSFVFYQSDIVQGTPDIAEANRFGCIGIGASLQDIFHPVTVSQGIFCQINFTAITTGTATLNIVPTDAPGYIFDTFLWNDKMITIEFASASFSSTTIGSASLPIASFTFTPSNPKANQTVTFDASASYSTSGTIASYVWNFSDGTITTRYSPNSTITHMFTLFGRYPVNLTVFDNDGFSASITKAVLVGRAPYVNFTYDWEERDTYPSAPYKGIVVTFNASRSYDPDGNITSYFWDFGDGNNETTYAPNATTTYIFAENGNYNVTLEVFDNDGLSNSTKRAIVVGIKPTATFSFLPPNPIPPNEPVAFDASNSTDPDGFIVLLTWDFGDFSDLLTVNATELAWEDASVVIHTYMAGGGYQVTFKVYDNDGLSSSVVKYVNVTITGKPPPPGVDLTQLAGGATIIIVLLGVAVWYRRRPEKEPGPKERYRVI
jgi:PKD repeat protein